MEKINSELKSEEVEEPPRSSVERNLLTCFSCNFETENIDELDEHIVAFHEDEGESEKSEKKFQIIKEGVPEVKVPRAKIIFKHHDSKFQICKDTEFDLADESASPRPKRAKRTPAEEMKCNLCSFVTRKKSVLATHMLNHSDIIPPIYYKCSQCPYQTKRKNDMPKHMLGHCSNESVPLYKCQYCPYVTKRKGDLPKHEMNHAERDKIFTWNCTECEYSTKRKNDLHKHMLVHSDKQLTGVFKCLKCAYASDKVVKFSRHVLSKCGVWDEPVSLEHLMLEDILATIDKSGVHVMFDAESDPENQGQENTQYVEAEGEEDDDNCEYVQYVEEEQTTENEEDVVIETETLVVEEILPEDDIHQEVQEEIVEEYVVKQEKPDIDS